MRRKKNKNKNKYIMIALVAVLILIISGTIAISKANSNKETRNASQMAEYIVNDENEVEEEQSVEEELLIVSINELPEEQIEEVEETKTETTQVQGTNSIRTSSTNKYYIKVNYQANVVTIYKNDGSGDFSPTKAMICSTGTHTPRSGKYSLKYRWEWLGLQGDVYGHYVTQITGNILFHSVPYLSKYNPASLEYWEFDKLGTSASLGCVRLQIKDCKWIYDNCKSGTIVEFYADSNPGPLGKPTAPKITSNIACRDWDPTDPNSSNPWNGASASGNTTNKATTNNDNTGQYSEDDEKKIREIIQNSESVNNNVNSNSNNNVNSNSNNNVNSNSNNNVNSNSNNNVNSTVNNNVNNNRQNTTKNTQTNQISGNSTSQNNVTSKENIISGSKQSNNENTNMNNSRNKTNIDI